MIHLDHHMLTAILLLIGVEQLVAIRRFVKQLKDFPPINLRRQVIAPILMWTIGDKFRHLCVNKSALQGSLPLMVYTRNMDKFLETGELACVSSLPRGQPRRTMKQKVSLVSASSFATL